MTKYPEFVPGAKKEEVKEEVKEEEEVVEDVYTVTYFPLYGRGEVLRIACELAGLKWVDNVV